jgi:hypothetical protein
VSVELILHVLAGRPKHDKIRVALEGLPPKVLGLSRFGPPAGEDVTPTREIDASSDRIALVDEQLRNATFTNNADVEIVLTLHRNYVKRIETVLIKVLHEAGYTCEEAEGRVLNQGGDGGEILQASTVVNRLKAQQAGSGFSLQELNQHLSARGARLGGDHGP